MEDEIKDGQMILCNGWRHRNPPADDCDSKGAIQDGICESYLDGEYPLCHQCFPESQN